jgi:hypothetical protein
LAPFNWICPHCGTHTTIGNDRWSAESHSFNLNSKYGNQAIRTMVVSCPNVDCLELTITATLSPFNGTAGQYNYREGDARESWQLVPRANMRVFPPVIPMPILADYAEACLVRDLSPKASATLARRCLQGMIRDFWRVTGENLFKEILAIKDRVDPLTWSAIDAVRSLGNIGAHMEKDINLIVDVDPDEAALLIGLIETLIVDWYVTRHLREERMKSIVAVADEKKAARASNAEN